LLLLLLRLLSEPGIEVLIPEIVFGTSARRVVFVRVVVEAAAAAATSVSGRGRLWPTVGLPTAGPSSSEPEGVVRHADVLVLVLLGFLSLIPKLIVVLNEF